MRNAKESLACIWKEEKKLIIKVLIILGFAIYIDCAQKGVLTGGWLGLYKLIKISGSRIGISYTKALELISSSFSVMLTVTNIIFTLTINVANRAENFVMGFSREELNFNRKKERENIKRYWVVSAPLLLMFNLNINFCAVTYVVLILSYCCVLSTFTRFYESFNTKKDVEMIINKVETAIINLENYDYKEYEYILMKLKEGKDKVDYWEKISKITTAVINESLLQHEKVCFQSLYCYFSIVIIPEIVDDGSKARKILEESLCHLEAQLVNEEVKKKDNLEFAVAGIIFSIGNITDERRIMTVMDSILNYSERSSRLIKYTGCELPIAYYEIEIGLLLLVIETMLWECDKIEDFYLTPRFIRTWECGRKYLSRNYTENRESIIQIWEDRLLIISTIPPNLKRLREATEKLCTSYLEGKGESIIFTVWENNK